MTTPPPPPAGTRAPDLAAAGTSAAVRGPAVRPTSLRTLVTLVVPAGRGIDRLAPLVDSLLQSARTCGLDELPLLLLATAPRPQVEPGRDELERRWREGGGELTWIEHGRTHAAALRNHATGRVSTAWIGFLDDDVTVDDQYLGVLARLCRESGDDVVQGIPYLCSNPSQALAALEYENYRDGFATYLQPDGTVGVTDARNLLIRTVVVREHPFNETLLFAGEGQELATRLVGAGKRPRYADDLKVFHTNRASLAGLLRQKYYHGRGRTQRLRAEGGLDFPYVRRYAHRHYVEPVADALRGRIPLRCASYRLATNSVFWLGAFREYLRRARR